MLSRGWFFIYTGIMKKQILLANNPEEIGTLRTKSEPVAEVDDAVRQLVVDMFDSMDADKGIGLSAPQIGVLQRVIICKYDYKEDPVPRTVLVNPEIIWASELIAEDEEGCLSFPGVYGMVKRPESIEYQGLDENGKKIKAKASGMLARIIQHEIDHLDGVLLPDRVEGDLYTYEKPAGPEAL